MHIPFVGRKKSCILRADLHILRSQQPRWNAAEVPFGTDIRAGTDDKKQASFLSDLCEAGDIEIAGEVELAGLLFVEVPEDVGGDRIQTHRLRFAKTVAPMFGWDARIVHFARADDE